MTEMAEDRRLQYQEFQPTFWRKAVDSAKSTLEYFGELLSSDENLMFVDVEGELVQGFIIAKEIPVPPVYDPGGTTYMIDDFCVRVPGLWEESGRRLLHHTMTAAKEKGAAQILVVCGEKDTLKARLLAGVELTVASQWWTKPL